MTKIEIELPDATAKAAREAGLLTPEALDRLLTLALKRKEQERDRAVTRAAAGASAPAFERVWSNPEDDAYDR